MDNNNTDPNNPPAAAPGLGQPAEMPPADPTNASWQPPSSPDMPQSPAAPGLNPSQGTPAPNPWDNLNQAASAQNPPNPTSDIFTTPAQPPVEAPPTAQAAWPSSTSTTGFGTQEIPAPDPSGLTSPNPPPGLQPVGQEIPNPMTANPFLQPQVAGMALPDNEQSGSDLGQPLNNTGPATPGSEPAVAPTMPALEQAETSTPLETPPISPTQNPMGNAFPPADVTAETSPAQAQTPATPEAPATFPPEQPAGSAPTPPAPEVPVPENPASTTSGQQGTLDLSALQSNSGTSENPLPQQPGNPLPEIGPQENAPTDLSHLIAGDESHNQPVDVYAPPVAQDQNPAVNPVQTPTAADGSTLPPGKHLNLTKVLLVAGIPIILIVAALSAYLILGIGKPASPDKTNQTSLPVEQTKQQAPLTNPPQQIVAPSPVTIPEPQTQSVGLESSGSGTALPRASASPAASLSPAMQAALKKASPSPSPSSASITTTPPAIP